MATYRIAQPTTPEARDVVTAHTDSLAAPSYEVAPPLPERVRSLQEVTAAPRRRIARRAFFVWFRIFVHEQRAGGKEQRVNLRLPIPIPLVGLLFGRRMTRDEALKLLAAAERSDDPVQALDTQADAAMALELIRVEEEKEQKHELVVIGFD